MGWNVFLQSLAYKCVLSSAASWEERLLNSDTWLWPAVFPLSWGCKPVELDTVPSTHISSDIWVSKHSLLPNAFSPILLLLCEFWKAHVCGYCCGCSPHACPGLVRWIMCPSATCILLWMTWLLPSQLLPFCRWRAVHAEKLWAMLAVTAVLALTLQECDREELLKYFSLCIHVQHKVNF